MRKRHERVYGPFKHRRKYRIYIVGAGGEDQREFQSFETEAEAAAAVRIARAKISARTIDATVTEYLAVLAGRVAEKELAQTTVDRDTYHLRKGLKLKEHGSKDLIQLTPALGEKLYDQRKGAVDSHRNGLQVCKRFGRWCVKQGYLKVSPFADVKGKGRRKKGKPQLYTDEARRFMDLCVELGTVDDGAVLALSYLLLGTRAGEILDRRVRELDAEGTILWIPKAKTQAGRRRLDVPPVLAPLLLRVAGGRQPNAKLFSHTTLRKRPADWAREQVTRICKLAEVPRMTPQALRGTCSTLADEAGTTAQKIAEHLGHAVAAPSVTTSGAYIHKERSGATKRRATLKILTGGRG